jgi:hypothetical protein
MYMYIQMIFPHALEIIYFQKCSPWRSGLEKVLRIPHACHKGQMNGAALRMRPGKTVFRVAVGVAR